MTDWLKIAKECAEEVMKDLGHYFTEGVYHDALMHEFRLNGVDYERARTVEIFYKGYGIGQKITDCILNPLSTGKGGSEYLLEFKAVKKIEKKHEMQLGVYLTSMNLNEGALLNFNTDNGKVDVEEVKKPLLSWKKDVAKLAKGGAKKISKKILKEVSEEILAYLGKGFYYDAESAKIYADAIAAELRLRGYVFTLVNYPVLYHGLHVEDYSYDFQFPSGEVVKVVNYENEKKKEEKIEEWEAMTKRFKLKNAFLLALPQKDGDAVVVREV